MRERALEILQGDLLVLEQYGNIYEMGHFLAHRCGKMGERGSLDRPIPFSSSSVQGIDIRIPIASRPRERVLQARFKLQSCRRRYHCPRGPHYTGIPPRSTFKGAAAVTTATTPPAAACPSIPNGLSQQLGRPDHISLSGPLPNIE